MPSVTFRLPPTLHQRLLKECEKRDLPVSDFLREAIERFIDRVEDIPFEDAVAAKISTELRSAYTSANPERFNQALKKFIDAPPPAKAGVRGWSTDGKPVISKPGSRLKVSKGKAT